MVSRSRVIRVGAVVIYCPRLYLLFLPFQIYKAMEWLTIPYVGWISIARKMNLTHNLQGHCLCFVLVAWVLGDRTGDVRVRPHSAIFIDVDDSRSENPFNYDLNDLDLDGFCLMLQRDLHEITAVRLFTGPEPSSLIVTSPRSTPARSSLTITSSPLGISHSPLLIGDLRKRS